MLAADADDRGDDVPADHLLGRARLRLRRLVPASRRGRLSPAVPLAPGLRLRGAPAADRAGRDGPRPADRPLARRGRDGRGRDPPLPLLAPAAEAGHREMRLLRPRRLGEADRGRRRGRRRPGCPSSGRSGSTTSTATRAGSSATRGRTRPRSCGWSPALRAAGGTIALRPTADIERLLDSPWYRVRRAAVIRLDPWDLRARRLGKRVRRLAKRPVRVARRGARAARRLVGSARS